MKLNKKTTFAVVIFLSVILLFAAGCKNKSGLEIDSLEPVKINGIDQWILIRAKDLSKPVLLKLHGGPGFSAIPTAHVESNLLEEKFIVVNWDQRGAGLSYNDLIPVETMNMKQFIDDTKKVTEYLKNKFNRDKIYLLGHSWGSILGISVVQKYPEDYYAYIGVGQVVSEESSKREIRKWLKKKFAKDGMAHNKKLMDFRLRSPASRAPSLWMYGGYTHKKIDFYKIKNSSPYYPEKYSSLGYKVMIISGPLVEEYMRNFDTIKYIKELKIPVYFFCGRYDYAVPVKPVENYYKILKAPHKEIVWFEESAHFMNLEEPEKYQNAIIKIAEKYSGS